MKTQTNSPQETQGKTAKHNNNDTASMTSKSKSMEKEQTPHGEKDHGSILFPILAGSVNKPKLVKR